MSAKRSALLFAVLMLLASARVRGVEAPIPLVLQEWKDTAYTQRYFLCVEVPGEAGNVDLLGDPPAASVLLPLRMMARDGQPAVPEDVLVIGEDGQIQQVLARQVPGGADVEIAFPTRPGLRRFCLYAGTPAGKAANASPATFQPAALSVRLRGRNAAHDFRADAKPLTLARFQEHEAQFAGALGVKKIALISDAECPWLNIRVDLFGHIQAIDNPPRYTALYEALLRAPVGGRYRFALDTPGAAHLLIDGKPVISAETPDASRASFALEQSIDLSEGVHRVTLYYAEANREPGKSNADLARFGARLHWQPPFSNSLMCVPAQAFVRALPAVVLGMERGSDAQPFIHYEKIGQVRVARHKGDAAAKEFVQVFAKGCNAPAGGALRVNAGGREIAFAQASNSLCAWVPAGSPVELQLVSAGKTVVYTRRVLLPASKDGAQNVLDLEGELAVKSAPEFLHPDETGQIHLEAMLSPAPVIVTKERVESKLAPPPPRPLGGFHLRWRIEASGVEIASKDAGDVDATPLDEGREKLRVPIDPGEWLEPAKSGLARLVLTLSVGDVPVQQESFRLLYSRSEKYPGTLGAGAGGLLFTPDASVGAPSAERVLMIVPREDELEHRRFLPLKSVMGGDLGKTALFLGDPLVEGQPPGAKALPGLAGSIAQRVPKFSWQALPVCGPHRHLPIFQMTAKLDAFARAQPGGKIPAVVVLSLGGGDAARQTPPHVFERALDALLDRLKAAGARKIVLIGVVPEPSRENQSAPYQARVADILRQHHLDGLDLFGQWTKESDWARRFSVEGVEGEDNAVFGAAPNSQTLDEIALALKPLL
jgi:hypothetical protein